MQTSDEVPPTLYVVVRMNAMNPLAPVCDAVGYSWDGEAAATLCETVAIEETRTVRGSDPDRDHSRDAFWDSCDNEGCERDCPTKPFLAWDAPPEDIPLGGYGGSGVSYDCNAVCGVTMYSASKPERRVLYTFRVLRVDCTVSDYLKAHTEADRVLEGGGTWTAAAAT